MNRTDRLYALVEELRAVAPRPRSARQLAERFEVSRRTIERDISALQGSGVPIYAEAGRCGGYVIDRTLTLPPLNFTAAEMVAIAVSLAREEYTPFAAATRSALRKVLATASAAQTAEAGELMDRVRLIGSARPGEPQAAAMRSVAGARPAARSREAPARDRPDQERPGQERPGQERPGQERPGQEGPDQERPGQERPGQERPGQERPGQERPGQEGPDQERPDQERPARHAPAGQLPARERAARRWGAPPAATVPLAIQEAITARHVLRITYRDRHDRETVRDVEPVAFAATRTQWYLMAWCRLRRGARAFRVDRIAAADDTGEPASPRSYRDLDVDIPDALVRRPDLRV
jgi:predicted DNA-binding transcriptional regulator YafY